MLITLKGQKIKRNTPAINCYMLVHERKDFIITHKKLCFPCKESTEILMKIVGVTDTKVTAAHICMVGNFQSIPAIKTSTKCWSIFTVTADAVLLTISSNWHFSWFQSLWVDQSEQE